MSYHSKDRLYLFVIFGTFIFTLLFWKILNNYQSHYDDKGYRLCMTYISKTNGGYISNDVISSCLKKYLNLEEKIIE